MLHIQYLNYLFSQRKLFVFFQITISPIIILLCLKSLNLIKKTSLTTLLTQLAANLTKSVKLIGLRPISFKAKAATRQRGICIHLNIKWKVDLLVQVRFLTVSVEHFQGRLATLVAFHRILI